MKEEGSSRISNEEKNMEKSIEVYHAGFEEIRIPDVHFGRKKADFGQGFYLSDDLQFSLRWSKQQAGRRSVINCYSLDLTGLKILTLQRDRQWFEYIFSNRHGQKDSHAEYDVIVGPIANDMIYDTLGIMTSGLLSDQEAFRLLQIGREYSQIVLKTQKAADQLKFSNLREASADELQLYHDSVMQEQQQYQQQLAEQLSIILDEQ